MSKDFEEKVLKKLDELDEKVSRIDAIEEKISCIDEINEKVSKIDEIEKIALANGRKIDHLDYRVGRIEGSLILMESKLNNDLKAIHEGHMFNTELRIEDRKRIDSLEKQDFDYAARISNLEFAIEKNSEQIKN